LLVGVNQGGKRGHLYTFLENGRKRNMGRWNSRLYIDRGRRGTILMNGLTKNVSFTGKNLQGKDPWGLKICKRSNQGWRKKVRRCN